MYNNEYESLYWKCGTMDVYDHHAVRLFDVLMKDFSNSEFLLSCLILEEFNMNDLLWNYK